MLPHGPEAQEGPLGTVWFGFSLCGEFCVTAKEQKQEFVSV